MSTTPFMTPGEIAFLGKSLHRDDHVWEWGGGASSGWLARRVRHVTTAEHNPYYAALVISRARPNQSVYFNPAVEWDEHCQDDGDLESFRRYVESYTGQGVTAVLIDGRARVACARQVAEGAAFGPFPGMRIFLHDCQRQEYAPIWETYFETISRVDNLMLLKPRL